MPNVHSLTLRVGGVVPSCDVPQSGPDLNLALTTSRFRRWILSSIFFWPKTRFICDQSRRAGNDPRSSASRLAYVRLACRGKLRSRNICCYGPQVSSA